MSQPVKTQAFNATTLQLTLLLAVLLVLFSPLSIQAQDSTVSNVLDRFGGLDVERNGPTIDAQLAQKFYRRGNTYSNLERYDEAIEEYRKAISADPGLDDAIRNLANIYYFLERYDQAKPLFARFIKLQTTTTAALIAAVSTLGELERQDGNFDQAIEYDLQAIELDSDNDSQVHIMANTYNNAGESEKAITIYRAAIETMPGNAFFDRSLGRILEQMGSMEEALAAYESAAAKDPDSQFYQDLIETTKKRLENQ